MTPERKAELRKLYATGQVDTLIPELLDAVDDAEEETRKVRDVMGRVLASAGFYLRSDLRAEAEAVLRGKT